MARIHFMLVALCFPAFLGAQPERAAAVGDVMVYSAELRSQSRTYEETVTVVAVEGGVITTRHERSDGSAPAEGLFGRDWSTVKSSSGIRYEPPTKRLQFPLEVGRSWVSEYVATAPNGAQFRAQMALRVGAREKLSTAAGEFDTYKIEMRGQLNGISYTASWLVEQTLWYAPALDQFVRHEFREDRAGGTHLVQELKSYRLKQ